MCFAITTSSTPKPASRAKPARRGAMHSVERRKGLGSMTGGLQMRRPCGPRNTHTMPCPLPSARSIGGASC
jgi:hypothetical protein